MMYLIRGLAAVAVTISSVHATSTAFINNNCDFDVYLWPTDAQRNSTSPQTILAGKTYNEAYHIPTSGGVSLKLSNNASDGPGSGKITQFEYTVQSYLGSNFIWYDGSNVDCVDANCPFYSNGISLTASIGSCPTRNCPINQVCTGFYTLWNDDVNSLSCDVSADITMTLCTVVQSLNTPDSATVVSSYACSTSCPSGTSGTVPSTLSTAYVAHTKRQEMFSIVPISLDSLQSMNKQEHTKSLASEPSTPTGAFRDW